MVTYGRVELKKNTQFVPADFAWQPTDDVTIKLENCQIFCLINLFSISLFIDLETGLIWTIIMSRVGLI